MPRQIWRVLIIDDNPGNTSDALRELTDAFETDAEIELQVTIENDFDAGFDLVNNGACDIVILDVRRDRTEIFALESDKGSRVYSSIREVRFLPVIFWTALPDEVRALEMAPLVTVFGKEHLDLVPNAIREAIRSGAPDVMASIERRVASVMREHMWDQLAPRWSEENADDGPEEVAHVLISRVAYALQDQALPELTKRPSHRYIYPPVSNNCRPGDVLRKSSSKGEAWSVILTPACDLEPGRKTEYVLLGRASSLSTSERYVAWERNQNADKWNQLKTLLENKLTRFNFLPEFRDVPDLVVDLENVEAIPIGKLSEYTRVASLVPPYAEALLTQHSHYRGRIGTPDLNSASIKERLAAAAAAIAAATQEASVLIEVDAVEKSAGSVTIVA